MIGEGSQDPAELTFSIGRISNQFDASRVGTGLRGVTTGPTTRDTNISMDAVTPDNLIKQMAMMDEVIEGTRFPDYLTDIDDPIENLTVKGETKKVPEAVKISWKGGSQVVKRDLTGKPPSRSEIVDIFKSLGSDKAGDYAFYPTATGFNLVHLGFDDSITPDVRQAAIDAVSELPPRLLPRSEPRR